MKTQIREITKYACLALAGSMLLSGRAMAQSETFTHNYGTPTPLGPGDSTAIVVNQFNPSLGTLQDVILTLNSDDQVWAQILNLTSSTQGYSGVSATAPVTVTTSVDSLSTTTTGTAEGSGNSLYAAGTVPGPQYTITSLPHVQQNVSASTTLNSGLAAFEGLNTFNVTVVANAATFGGSAVGGTLGFGGDYSSSGNFTVEYDYSAVPEVPVTGSFMGAGCLAFLGFSLLRRKVAASARA